MGTKYIFRCHKCGYEVKSFGKLDHGRMAVVEPYICNDCNELTDVLVGEFSHKFANNDLPDDGNDYYSCSNCKSENITIWNIKKKPCPKCNHKMKRGHSIVDWN